MTEPAEEFWTHAETRLHNGKRFRAWLPDGNDDELYYRPRGTYTIGSRYQVSVSRTDAKTTLHGTPTYTGTRHPDNDVRARLEARHRAAKDRLRLLALERNDKRRSALDAALVAIAAGLRGLDRAAFLLCIQQRINRAWR